MTRIKRTALEIGLISFLIYSGLLMREFTRLGPAQGRGLVWALSDILTAANVGIAAVVAIVGSVVIELLMRKA